MPITAWKCQGCGGREVPLDHFATTPCGYEWRNGVPPVHPSFAAAVLHHDRAHYARGSGVVEVSNGLGCPREVGIMLGEVAVDPLMSNAALGGTAWHGMMENVEVDGIQLERVVSGKFGLIPVQGKVDMLRPAQSLVEDWKTKTCFKAKGIKEAGAEENDRAQVSIYAALTEQQDGWRPTRGIIWYRFQAGGVLPVPVKLMGEEEFLSYKPTKNPTWTVMDLWGAVDAIHRGILKWQDAPMVGNEMYYGAKKKCHYCPVADICWRQETNAPFMG